MDDIIVNLHAEFEFGTKNTKYFKDYSLLTAQQELSVVRFMNKVVNGQPLTGKNKPSWLYDDGAEITGSSFYKENLYWHYHSGPSYSPKQPIKSMTINLGLNISGLTSPEIIHYQKVTPNEVLIVGYSPEHDPFPQQNNPRKDLPTLKILK
jgi:hypothetical protein